MPQSGDTEYFARCAQQLAAFAATLQLELDSHARAGMAVSEAVNRNFRIAHTVEIRDERWEAIDAKVSPASYWCPMHEIPDARDSRQQFPRRQEVLQPPIGRDEQGNPQFGMSIEKPLEASECATSQVTAGFVLIMGGCRMNIVDTETHRALHSSRQPVAARD
jgi:hypothetical protein